MDKNKVTNFLKDGTQNIIQSCYDNFIKSNAELRGNAGLKSTITRMMMGECCAWCAAIAGTYEYGKEPKDIYRRHKNCDCVVIFKSEKGYYQDAHTRKKYEKPKEAIEEIVGSIKKSDVLIDGRKTAEKRIIDSQKEKRKNRIDYYTGPNNKTILAEHKEWIGENKMEEYLAKAEGEDLKKYIRADFRKTSFIGDGSTAAIREYEIETGLKCGRNGNDHAQKVDDLIAFLNRLLLKEQPKNDKIILEEMLERLTKVAKK